MAGEELVAAGELLREARLRHGLTQRQLAIRARTSQAAISRIEHGMVSPTIDTLAELLWMMNEELILRAVPLDWGFDLDLLRTNLALSPEKRIRRAVVCSRRTSRMNGAAEHLVEAAPRTPIRGEPVSVWRSGDLRLVLGNDGSAVSR